MQEAYKKQPVLYRKMLLTLPPPSLSQQQLQMVRVYSVGIGIEDAKVVIASKEICMLITLVQGAVCYLTAYPVVVADNDASNRG